MVLAILYRTISSIEMEEAPLVKTAANLFRRSCYKGRENTIAGIICAGWDKRRGGQVREEGGGGHDAIVMWVSHDWWLEHSRTRGGCAHIIIRPHPCHRAFKLAIASKPAARQETAWVGRQRLENVD